MSFAAHLQPPAPAPAPQLTAARAHLAAAMAAALARYGGPAPQPAAEPDPRPAAPKAASRRTAQREEAWLRLGAAIGHHLGEIADRHDLVVSLRTATRSGAKGTFYPAEAKIELERALFGKKTDPASLNPDQVEDLARYPAAWGVLTHEAAHAVHSRWSTPPAQRGTGADRAAAMLEESRAEHRQLTRRPQDARWLRASAAELILADFTTGTVDDPWIAGQAAGLVLARADAGVLSAREVSSVRTEVVKTLSPGAYDTLRGIWQRAHQAGDEDGELMLELGAAWCQALGTPPEQPAPEPAQDQGKDRGKDAGGRAPGTGGRRKIASAVRRAVRKIDPSATPGARGTVILLPSADPRAQERQAAARGRAAAKDVFGTGASAQKEDSAVISGTRAPTGEERAAAGQIARQLRAAAVRERTEVRTTSALPPGRLRMRGALARDAQIAAGAMPTAEPWSAVIHRHNPTPPLRVGIAVDASGSMRKVTAPLSSAAWVLASATGLADPANTSATVAFGTDVTAITRPGRAARQVAEFAASGGSSDFARALDALDGALGLSSPGTARLLVVISDGIFPPDDLEEGQRRVTRLVRSGCAVLWLLPGGNGLAMNGARRAPLADPAQAAALIGKAAALALATAR
jgi:hypothetical protein